MLDLTLKVLIADDDECICNLLSDILSTFEDVTVAGKTTSGKKLLELVKETSPDTVFVDVQMPDLDGLSVVHRLQKENPGIFTVFISAHAQYAAEAFNLDATDYLVKPVNRERIGRALNKVKRFKELQFSSEYKADLSYISLGCAEKVKKDNINKLTLKSGHGIVLIDTESIFYIEKVGKKCVVHTKHNRDETPENLTSIEQKLNSAKFFRCHKSFIINIYRVEKVLPYADRAYEVTFYNYPNKVTMRRDKFEEFCLLIKC